ncbi:acyltransferase family protein [Bradyrhizobium sp. AZCC 2230]|uniref:acyltransferase family protein n=1 Tax=Bradyrhizobium sp. AZCC 2230 TaxID=3117021 RepID=UPI002FF1A510
MSIFPGIQALRAIAATLVVFQHAAYMASLSAPQISISPDFGRVGVILFFVISGFVIALQRAKPVPEFAIQRALRIYPGYWLALLIEACFFFAIHRVVAATPASVLLYPATASSDFTSIPYWTLVFEVAFYAVAAITFAARLSDLTLTVLCVAWIAAIHLFSHDPASVTEYGFPGLSLLLSAVAQNFPMGVICAINYHQLRRIGPVPLLIIGAVAFAASFHLTELSRPRIFCVGLSSCCVLLAFAHLRAPRIVMALGDISYGIYLMHFPAMVFAASFVTLPLAAMFSWGMIASASFGLLEHKLYNTLKAARSRPQSAAGQV